ncbi:O-antigen/teichoic acid export membrane protein [Salsuginibacillus halophilus]|uniref:O-antigen/teichoic acid export membrane protein n=1 Tax=Salsuginibacillus halophilus TaxID=517424 RepID=A0A2P8HQN4_9BACI|nr:polysaccharide biosynthesis protein [Salsuginibacillus halophilus]PSL48525.1 O-antigen/teichoic acid export membrane protein [Salsuginibacillus halophilus]
MAQTLIKSALFLTAATFLSKVLGSVFRIPLQNIAGDDVFGIFSMVYPVYMAVLIITVAGIPIAISKLISEARFNGGIDDIRDIFASASIVSFSFGVISFLLMFSLADHIALLLGGSYAAEAVRIVSFALIIAPYMAVYRGFFQGYDDMQPTAVSQVLEQLIRVLLLLALAVILVEMQAESSVVAGGVMAGSAVGALASLVYLRRLFVKSSHRPKPQSKFTLIIFRRWSKRILLLALPICAGALVLPILSMIDSVTVPLQLHSYGYSADAVPDAFGVYSRGTALVQIAVVFASALILPLIPAVTGALARGEEQGAAGLIEKSMKLSHLTALPAAAGLFALTAPLNLAFFGSLDGHWAIAVLHLSAAPMAYAIVTTGMLQGVNQPVRAAAVVIGGALVKAGLNVWLVPIYGLEAAAGTTLGVYTFIAFIHTAMIRKRLAYTTQRRVLFVSAIGSLLIAAAVGLPLFVIEIEAWSRLAALIYSGAAVAGGVIIFAAAVWFGRAVTKEDLRQVPGLRRFAR